MFSIILEFLLLTISVKGLLSSMLKLRLGCLFSFEMLKRGLYPLSSLKNDSKLSFSFINWDAPGSWRTKSWICSEKENFLMGREKMFLLELFPVCVRGESSFVTKALKGDFPCMLRLVLTGGQNRSLGGGGLLNSEDISKFYFYFFSRSLRPWKLILNIKKFLL